MPKILITGKTFAMVLAYFYIGLSASCVSEEQLNTSGTQVFITTSYKKMPVHFCLKTDEIILNNLRRGRTRLDISITHLQSLPSYTPTLFIAIDDTGSNQKIPVDQFSLYTEGAKASARPSRAQSFSVQLSEHIPQQQNIHRLCFELSPDLSEKNAAIERDTGMTILAGFNTRPE